MPGAGDRAVPCQTDNQVRRTRYRSGVKAIGVGRFEDLWGEVEVVLVVVGCQEREIAQGWWFCPAKPKTERDALGIGLVWRPLAWVILRTYGVR
jgi:hypothetical protein